MEHHHTAGTSKPTAAEFIREAAQGVSSAFVLVAMMLPLGLIAFAPIGSYAVEAGLSAAFAAAIFGTITAFFLSGALLPNEVPRASSVFLFAAFVLRLAGEAELRASPSQGAMEILFLAALCLLATGHHPDPLRRAAPRQHRALRALSRGGGPHDRARDLARDLRAARGARHPWRRGWRRPGGEGGGHGGINGWTLLVGLVTIVVFVVVRKRWPQSPAKLIGLAAGTAVATVVTMLLHADVGPRVPSLGRLPLPNELLPLFSPTTACSSP